MSESDRTPGVDDKVAIDDNCWLARYADWHSRGQHRRVAALGSGRRDSVLFVEDEVLVDGRDEKLVAELMRRYGAEVVPEPPLPEPPPELRRRHRRIDLAAMPRTLRLRLTEPPSAGEALGLLAEAAKRRRSRATAAKVTSERGARVASVVIRHALEGRRIGLNVLGESFVMPLTTAQEGPGLVYGNNPYQWPAFAGRTRMVDAWQLIDSIRSIVGDRFITVGILDGGFWLDNGGAPIVAAGQPASDFGVGVMQLNLQNEGQPAGGPNPANCGASACPWHGNAVASAAAAALNDQAGAAGSGGSVARPFLFRTDLSEAQVLRCVRICTAWGIDVLNMSFGLTVGDWELTFGSDEWEDTFQFAADNGVVLIAAAGNSMFDLPDDAAIRPATRTPGVLTVGALDAADNAWSGTNNGSNFGSSVNLWAPGVNIEVAPDPNNLQGRRATGTSFAAPIVAGVAAMMRYADPAIGSADVRRILVDNAWPGAGRVSRGLDAFAAVFATIHGTLPDNAEPNDLPQSAAPLIPGPGGALVPSIGIFTTRSTRSDRDYWGFSVSALSQVTVSVDWYQRLSSLYVAVEGEDPEARGPDEMRRTGGAATESIVLDGLLPPGNYRVRVSGDGATAYRLAVRLAAAELVGDGFEPNDSFDAAATLAFERDEWTLLRSRTWGPGTFDATLHLSRRWWVLGGPSVMNDDYFRFEVPRGDVFRQPTIAVFDADVPLDVTLFDAARAPLQTWSQVRKMRVKPPPESTVYLKVSAAAPTRYRISSLMALDSSVVPGPLQEELVFVLPDWWMEPTLHLQHPTEHFLVDLAHQPEDAGSIDVARSEPGLRLQLLDVDGQAVRDGQVLNDRVTVDTRGLERGRYLLRVQRDAESAGSIGTRLSLVPPLPPGRER